MKVQHPLGPRNGRSYLENARTARGGIAPDWIEALAAAADTYAAQHRSINDLAAVLGWSNAKVTSIINNNYRARLDGAEATVRGKLMSATVDCPAAGMTIGRDLCGANQKRAASSANPLTAKFPAACRNCKHAIGGSKP